ncbi:MAG: DUF5107 domain-containing protein [Lacisediminihabitans sp.]
MTTRIATRRFSIAELGEENLLPMVGSPLETPYQISGALPREIIDGSRFGNPANLYPFQEQDDYSRALVNRPLQTVTLVNDNLRAVFLPELGGRLWELFDKRAGVQLLHSPDTIQFANLGLRNAWFAGGIEWNIGTRGHSPTTCSPLHAAVVHTAAGIDVLRMWEFDRLREVVFQIDAWLPENSRVLFVAVRLRNPNDRSVPMYWWSNAAMPQSPQSRVVVPADSAFASSYVGGISRIVPNDDDGVDCTWPTNNRRARDFFFDIPPERRKWILSTDARGDGLAMVSSSELGGRKLFVWGEGDGGNRWQDWLSPDGERYAEIQAGLAQTQFQHLEMPGSTEWRWVEAYGNAAVDADIARGSDWEAAVEHCEQRVTALVSGQEVDDALAMALSIADQPPQQHVLAGSGWGALEAARRARNRLAWIDETGTPFAAQTITESQRPWFDLLDGTAFAGASGYVRGDDWAALLAAQPDSAEATAHRAVIAHARGAAVEARELYARSSDLAPSALAYRGLAMLQLDEDDAAGALEHYRLACACEPSSTSLLIEAAAASIRAGFASLALQLIEHSTVSRVGRVLLLEAQALAQMGESERAAAILRAGIEVADLREGENAMAELWRSVCPGEPVPARYQFSMTEEERG